jgi:hypothetical protein
MLGLHGGTISRTLTTKKIETKEATKILAKKYRKSWYGQSEKRVLELPKKI